MAALSSPVPGAPITGRFGDPRPNGPHTGIDFGVRIGTPVRAPAAGQVRDVWWNLGGGRMLAIRHADGSESRFAHLSSTVARTGQHVADGQHVAYSGATGTMVVGAHLHYELHIGGRPVDPAPYLAGTASIGTGQPSLTLGEVTPEAPAGTYPDVNGSGGGRCDVAAGWRDASAIETAVRPELTGYCVRITPASIAGGAAGAAIDAAVTGLVPVAANVGLVVAALAIAWGGVRRILDG